MELFIYIIMVFNGIAFVLSLILVLLTLYLAYKGKIIDAKRKVKDFSFTMGICLLNFFGAFLYTWIPNV